MSESTFTFGEFSEMYPEIANQIDTMIRSQHSHPSSYSSFSGTAQQITDLLHRVGFSADSILTPNYPGFHTDGVNTFTEWKTLVARGYQFLDQWG